MRKPLCPPGLLCRMCVLFRERHRIELTPLTTLYSWSVCVCPQTATAAAQPAESAALPPAATAAAATCATSHQCHVAAHLAPSGH